MASNTIINILGVDVGEAGAMGIANPTASSTTMTVNVKGAAAGADTITITHREMLSSQNASYDMGEWFLNQVIAALAMKEDGGANGTKYYATVSPREISAVAVG